MDRFCSYLESSQIPLGENDSGVYHPPPPLPAARGRGGGQGSQKCENVDPNRTFQNSDLSSAMVSDTTCVAYGTHTHSRKLRSAAEALQPSRQRRIRFMSTKSPIQHSVIWIQDRKLMTCHINCCESLSRGTYQLKYYSRTLKQPKWHSFSGYEHPQSKSGQLG